MKKVFKIVENNSKDLRNPQKFKSESLTESNDLNSHVKEETYVWKNSEPERLINYRVVAKEKIVKPDNGLDFQKSMPIKTDGVNCAYIGKFPFKIGGRPQRFIKPDADLSLFYNLRGKDLGLPNPDRFRVVTGAWPTNRSYLQLISNTSKKAKVFSKFSIRKLMPVIEKYIDKLHIRELPEPSIQNLDFIEYSGETDPGPRWSTLLGFKTKTDAAPYALNVAKKCLHNTYRGKWRAEGLYSVGGREVQKDDCNVDGTEITSRGILMPEMHEFLIEQLYARPIEKLFFDRQGGPIYLGQSFKHNGWYRLQKDLNWSKYVLEGDWKKFDTSVSNELMIMAFSVLRSFYKDSESVDNVFKRFISNTVMKKVLTPGGFIYEFSSSVPSGSSWTSLLNSIVNFIILALFCDSQFNIKDPKSVRFVIGGDDFLILFKRLTGKQLDLALNKIEKVKDDFNELTGMELNKNFNFTTPFPESIMDSPSFYKTTIYKGLPTIRPDHLIELIYIPKSSKRKSWNPVEYLLDVFAQGPGPFTHFKWVFDYLFIKEMRAYDWPAELVKDKYLENAERLLSILKERMNTVSNSLDPIGKEKERQGKSYIRKGKKINRNRLSKVIATFGFIKGKDRIYSKLSLKRLEEFETGFLVFE